MKHLHIQVPSSETEEECVALLHLTLRHLFLSLSLCHSALVYSVGYVKADPDATRCGDTHTHNHTHERTKERKANNKQTNNSLLSLSAFISHLCPACTIDACCMGGGYPPQSRASLALSRAHCATPGGIAATPPSSTQRAVLRRGRRVLHRQASDSKNARAGLLR